MKVVELRAERAKIYEFFDKTHHYFSSTDNREMNYCGKVKNKNDKVLKENYETDKALLERLDKINNILMESDANTYIVSHRLSTMSIADEVIQMESGRMS